jgi:AcrR family transcriptional regulator
MARSRNGVAHVPPRVRSEEVYSAALRLFTEKGYHATSMQDIAAEVGLYKGSLYHYIGSKEDLLVQVFQRAMDSLLARVEQIVADTSRRPSAQLREVIRAHVEAVAANPDALTVYLHEFRALAGEALEGVRAQRDRYRELVETIVDRGVRLGDFSQTQPQPQTQTQTEIETPAPPETVDIGIATLGLLGMCNWVVQWYQPGGRLTPTEIADRFADMVLGGLLHAL